MSQPLTLQQIIKSFVIGSSVPIVLLFYFSVLNIPDLRDNINLKTYPIIVAIYFGTLNVVSLFIGNAFNLTLFHRLLVIDIISIILVSSFITLFKDYPWENPLRWLLQYLLIAIGHSIAFLGIINFLERVI